MVKNLPAVQENWVQSLGRKVPWRREWLPTPGFLPGEFHGQRGMVGYCPLSHRESDMTKWLTTTGVQWMSKVTLPGSATYFLLHQVGREAVVSLCYTIPNSLELHGYRLGEGVGQSELGKKKRPVKNTTMVQEYNWVHKVSRFPTNRHSVERWRSNRTYCRKKPYNS